MPKAETIHKNFKLVTVREPNGNEYQVRTTYHNTLLIADISPDQHPAWTGQTGAFLKNSDSVSKFNKRFSVDFLSSTEGSN